MREPLPLGSIVGPGPRPLAGTPRIPDLHKPEVLIRLQVCSGGPYLEQREGVLRHKPLRLTVGLHAATAEHRALTVVVPQQLEQLRVVVPLVAPPKAASPPVVDVVLDVEVTAVPTAGVHGLVAPSLPAGHADDAPLRDAGLNRRVVAAELREGLLQDHRPDLPAVRPRILRLGRAIPRPAHAVRLPGVALARHVVVDDNDLPTLLLRVE
mmetsp:Transcript_25955/g.74796  ORF Transcript_25955/g.74796 Transcript_25955/m.74796 type:complete len:210 (+) Transcript_25955:427-1056(+)